MSERPKEQVLRICPVCGEIVTAEHVHKQVESHVIRIQEALGPQRRKAPRLGVYGGKAYVRFSGLAEWAARQFRLGSRIAKANMSIPPEGYAAKAVYYTFIAAAVAIPVSIVLSVIFASITPLVLVLAPEVIFLASMYYPAVKASARAETVDLELAFLTTYLSMAVSAGVPFYEAIKRIGAEPNPLKGAAKEAMTIRTMSEYFLKDEELSMEQLAAAHPSKALRSWAAGILHVVRMGGDLVAHLDDEVDRALTRLEELWGQYVEHASTIGTLTAMLYALIPISVYVFLLVMITPGTLTFAIFYTFFLSPLGAVMLIGLTESGRPKPPVSYAGYYKLTAVSAVPAAIFGLVAYFLFNLQLPYVVGLGAIVLFAPSAVKYERDWSVERSVETSLPRLIDDIAENRRVGQDVDIAFQHVAGKRRYGRALDRIVDMLAFNITYYTMSISQVLNKVKLRSWHSQAIFFLLREATETGGGGTFVFDRLARFADRYVDINQKVMRTLRGYQGLFYAISVAIIASMLFVANFIVSPQTGLLGTLSAAGGPASILATSQNLSLMETVAITGAVLNAVMLGLIAGKVGRGTIAGGAIHVIIGATIALVTILALNALMPGLTGLFPGLTPSAPPGG